MKNRTVKMFSLFIASMGMLMVAGCRKCYDSLVVGVCPPTTKLYIKQNKHLPDVPSAEEVVNSGIDMAKIDTLLLQKIEELNLYVLQLEKVTNYQQQIIKKLGGKANGR